MNVIFLTLGRITDVESRGIYQDLMRKDISSATSVTMEAFNGNN